MEELPRQKLTTDALVYEALQRHFRNAVVDHIRKRLVEAYPDTWRDVLRKPFKPEEWANMVSSADAATATGVVKRKPLDDFDYLGVNHFFGLFESNFKVLVPSVELPSEEYLPKLRQQVLGWMRETKAIRDPISHPPTEDLAPADALRAVDSALRLLQLLHLGAVSNVSGIYGQLAERAAMQSPPEILPPLQDTLPARETMVSEFVGRQKELAALWSWLIGTTTYRWMIAGDGGKGKSAIAYQFAQDVRVAAPKPFCGVFWMSAKRKRFEEGAVLDISSPDFWDIDSALNAILRSYGWAEEVNRSTAAKKLIVMGLLEELPCLLVVDDLDSIPREAEDTVEFLTLEAPKAKSKVLITSKREFLGMGRTCTVIEGLSREAALEFIESRIKLMRLDKTALTPKLREEIIQLCEGSPLYMEELLRFCKFVPVPRALDDWRQKPGDLVRRYALEREMQRLLPRAKEVLEICAIAMGPTTLLEIERVSGLSHDAVLEAIEELMRWYLVPAPELIENVPRFQVNRNLALLVKRTLEGTRRLDQIESAFRAVRGSDPGTRHRSVVGDYCRQAKVLVDAGRHEDAEATLKAGLGKMPNEPTLLGMLGWVYRRCQPVKGVDARGAWQRAHQLGAREASMYFHWSSMEAELNEWERAVAVVDLAFERLGREDLQLLQQGGYVRSRYGQYLNARFDEDHARKELEKADAILDEALLAARAKGRDADISRAFRALVLNAQARGDQKVLCRRLVEWLEWNSLDIVALKESERQRARCPDVAKYLAATPHS